MGLSQPPPASTSCFALKLCLTSTPACVIVPRLDPLGPGTDVRSHWEYSSMRETAHDLCSVLSEHLSHRRQTYGFCTSFVYRTHTRVCGKSRQAASSGCAVNAKLLVLSRLIVHPRRNCCENVSGTSTSVVGATSRELQAEAGKSGSVELNVGW